MKLIIYFRGPCTFLNECLDFLQLTLVSSLKPGRIMENELRVVSKGKWPIDVVDPTIDGWLQQIVTPFVVNARFVGRIANPLQESCLARIGPTNHKNTKMTVFLSSFKGG